MKRNILRPGRRRIEEIKYMFEQKESETGMNNKQIFLKKGVSNFLCKYLPPLSGTLPGWGRGNGAAAAPSPVSKVIVAYDQNKPTNTRNFTASKKTLVDVIKYLCLSMFHISFSIRYFLTMDQHYSKIVTLVLLKENVVF